VRALGHGRARHSGCRRAEPDSRSCKQDRRPSEEVLFHEVRLGCDDRGEEG
jgi:hypothetical protein